MARLPAGSHPTLRRHKARNQGVVTLNGHDHYLGLWPESHRQPPPAVRDAYDRLIALWVANGRRPLDPAAEGPTINEVIVAFLAHAERHYRKPDGARTSEFDNLRHALRPLRQLFGDSPAWEFGPLKLKAVRQRMVEDGLARTLINQRVGQVRRMFRWAAGEELVPVTVYQALATVQGLQKGRSHAREPKPVGPADLAHVEATLPFLMPPVAAMVELQRLSGMRPGEACALRPCDLERSGPVWLYRPPQHKTAHKGKARVVPIGPRAQALLAPYLLGRAAEARCFSPREALARQRERRRAARKTKVQPYQQDRRVSAPKRCPGDGYTPNAYALAVARACLAAAVADLERRRPDLLPPVREAEAGLKTARSEYRKAARAGRRVARAKFREAERLYRGAVAAAARAGGSVEHWHPNQLRHLHGTEVRRRFGLEAAQVALGHSTADVTQVYAERDRALAERVAREVG
jgi:integrase